MRGTPWIRFLLMAAALALVALPIRLLTREEPPSAARAPAVEQAPAERDVVLEIETAPAAQSIRASYLGRELIARAGGSFSGTIRLPAGSPADLVVTAKWEGTGVAALRVRASDENGPLAEASFWGTQQMEDVFTVPEAAE